MIVKEGNKWLVKDSSGKKILGTHPTKEKALKQLAAVEISKKESKMQNEEHELKIRCAKLNEIKKSLLETLKNLNEQLASQGVPVVPPSQQGIPQPQGMQKKGRPSPKQAIESPMKAQHGLAHVGKAAEAQEDVLKSYSDNPETPEVEEAKDASWQSVNSAVANYMSNQLQKLAQTQQM